MEAYKVFRVLAIASVLGIVVIAILNYNGYITDKNFAILSAMIAILGGLFGVFANKTTVDEKDVSKAVGTVLLTYDEKTLKDLKLAKEEETKIRDFIENKSNEIFLLRLRSYLEAEIISKYKDSELAKLIADLEDVERELRAINVKYEEVELPERFKQVLSRLNVEERMNLYLNLLDAIPFFPLKNFAKAYFRILRARERQRT
jgi:hypothetical protein